LKVSTNQKIGKLSLQALCFILLSVLVFGSWTLGWDEASSLPTIKKSLVFAETLEHYVARRVSEESKATAGWSAVTMTPAGGIAGSNFTVGEEYLIMCWGEYDNSNNASDCGIRVTHDTTPFTESQTQDECDRTGAAYKTAYFWFTVWTGADEDITAEYYGENTNNTRVEDITLVAINVDQLITDGDLQYDIQTGGGTLTTTPTSKASLSWQPANDGDTWWIMSYSREDVQSNTTLQMYEARLNIDSTTYTQQSVEGEFVGNQIVKGIGWAQTFDDTTHDVDLELSTSSASTHDWLAAGIFALRLNIFEDFAIDTAVGQGTVMNVDDAWVENQVSVAPDVSTEGNWLITGGAIVNDNNDRVHTRLQNGTTSITDATGGWQCHNTADMRAHTLADFYSSLSTGSQDFNLDGRITQAGVGYLYDAWLASFSMELAAIPIDVSGTIYTNETKSATVPNGTNVWLSVNGDTPEATTTTSGAFTFSNVSGVADASVVIFINDDTTYHANLITDLLSTPAE